ncbi:MAG: thiamine-phosphate kinase [Actinomycetota bacterium]
MRLADLGEFGVIGRLRELVGEPPEGEVWVGDDAAVLRAPAGTILFTADLLVEGVHFDLEITGPEDLGYKSIAVNVSDVAAMGGTPRRALVSLGLRPGMELEWIEALYRGMRAASDRFGMAVVGGDISSSGCLVISVALLGNPAGRRVIERRGARPGDMVCITGTLGASAAGYRLLRAGMRGALRARPDLREAHLRPSPRLPEAEVLRRHLPSAMIDVSDGFAADLGHLCEASEVGVVVDASRLPVVDLSGLELDREPLELALTGGEDYELCFTMPRDRAEAAAAEVERRTGTRVSIVGEVVEQARGRVLTLDGLQRPFEGRGWDHLRAGGSGGSTAAKEHGASFARRCEPPKPA